MKTLSVATGIVPIAEFKSGISKWFKEVRDSGKPLVITQNGKPAGVLLSPQEYDDLVYRRDFLDSVERGLEDVRAGRFLDTQTVRAALRVRRGE